MIMTQQARFDVDAMEDQTGRVAIVTGSNSGIGFETALALAQKGAQVVLACRSEKRGLEAQRRILKAHPSAAVFFIPLDLSDLEKVDVFAQTFQSRFNRLDLRVKGGQDIKDFDATRQNDGSFDDNDDRRFCCCCCCR